MKLEKQVSSLELSKKLKELGVKQESLFYWRMQFNGEWILKFDDGSIVKDIGELYSAFTVAELGEMLPAEIEFNSLKWHLKMLKYDNVKNECKYQIGYYNVGVMDWHKHSYLAETEADARAKMLLYLIENKLITL